MPKHSEPIEWLTAAEAAQHLKVKTRTLLFWVKQGKVRGYRLSGTKRGFWAASRNNNQSEGGQCNSLIS
jgi:excisionase family DNA binding protein